MMTNEELQEAREYTTCQEYDCSSEDIIKGLLAHIDEQASQIAALKAICVKERDRQIGCERETIEQLAQEYPEIFGQRENSQ